MALNIENDEVERLVDELADITGAGIVLGARSGFERPYVPRFVQTFDVDVIPLGSEHWVAATRAYERFGTGRHRAALHFGDCLSYATAHLAEQPLLCVGTDFSETELPLVEL